MADHELEEDAKHRVFEEKFGRELAQKIYDPKGTKFEADCIGLLFDYLFSFTDQLDLSLIDEDTIDTIDNKPTYKTSAFFLNGKYCRFLLNL